MSNIQYAVYYLQCGNGNDSGMSCHIERKDANGKKYILVNVDAHRTHLNRELVSFSAGVKNRTDANLKWLRETFEEDNLVSCVLHMDEKTPHLHAIVVPIVTTERLRKKREGEKKYETKSGPRLSADDVMRRSKLHEYQNSYAVAMKPFGLQRGIVGSTAKHQANSEYYKQQISRYEEDIARLQADIEKAREGKNTILSWFGKGDLAKAKKKGRADSQTERSNPNTHSRERASTRAIQIRHLTTAKRLSERDRQSHRAETVERQSKEKDAVIDKQKQHIDQLDRKANPQRYCLSSGAELVRINVPNYRNPSLHIWTRVGNEVFEETKFQIDYKVAQAHFNR